MGTYADPGSHSFQLAVNSDIYVDKTGLLEVLNHSIGQEKHFFAVSRARRFGKSMAAGMIDAYYSIGCDSEEMFAPYIIAQSEDFKKHLNQYHVLHFDANEFLTPLQDTNTYVERMDQALLRDMRETFPEQIEADCPSAAEAVNQVYKSDGRQFVIVIDEWDCLIRDEKDREELILSYLKFLRGFFKTEKSKRFLALGYITGILPIKKIEGESAMNNFDEYTMAEPKKLAPFFGFTEEELMPLLKESGAPVEEVKRWYDGYLMRVPAPGWNRGEQIHIYNPNSLVMALTHRELTSYWKNTASFAQLNNYIALDMGGLKEDVVNMLAGERVAVQIYSFQNDLTSFKSKDDVLTALIHMGYLGYDSETKEAFIPNEEVAMVFEAAISVGDWSDLADALHNSDALLRATWAKDEEKVASMIGKSHQDIASILTYHRENDLALAVRMAYYTARREYHVFRELPTGKGFADLAFVPRGNSDKPPMIVELKWDRDAESALQQIRERNYGGKLADCKHILLVGISYDKTDKKYSCVIGEDNLSRP